MNDNILYRQMDKIAAYMYGFIALMTFGHFWSRVALPATFPPELLLIKAIFSFIVSIFWPLYWSVNIWS